MRATYGLLLLFGLSRADVIVNLRKTLRPYRIYEDMPARFGQGVPDEGLLGYLVPAEPLTACHPIKAPPPLPPHPDIPDLGWIALIRRSGSDDPECTFEDKVRSAMEANFSAAIVFNYGEDELIPMGGSDDSLIPSVFLTHTDGEKLRQHYTYSKEPWKYVIKMTDNTPFDINAYLLPFAIVVGICFLVMLGIMVFKCVQDRRRERRHRLPKSSLKKIPTKKFTQGMEAEHETCCICLDDYVIGDKLRVLPCSHAYHVKCIDPWLLKNKRVCPQCRKKVFASGEVPPSDSDSETEDEHAPLLARARPRAPGGTFTTLRENPFRRAARRLAARSAPVHTDTRRPDMEIVESGSDSEEEDGGEMQHRASIMGNQLLAEVTIEQSRVERADSPTFNRLVSGQAELQRVYHGQEREPQLEVKAGEESDEESQDPTC